METIKWSSYRNGRLEELKEYIGENNVKLIIVKVPGDAASDVYVNQKLKAASIAGIDARVLQTIPDISEEELIHAIEGLNKDDTVNGIIVQLPLPKHLNEEKIVNTIDPDKDVDGLTYVNQGKLVYGSDGLIPCTAKGVLEMLDVLNVDLKGKKVVIIGRSKLVGLPLYQLMLKRNATPVICHRQTKIEERDKLLKEADVIVSAAGSEKPFITADMIKEGSVIIDVSICPDENGKLHGDVCYDEVSKKAAYVSPVPGGVGQMTVLNLMNNTYIAYLKQLEKTIDKVSKRTPRVPFLFDND